MSTNADVLAHFSPGFGGTKIPDWLKHWLSEGLGGITLFSSNCPSLEETSKLITQIRSYSPNVIISIDEEGGDVTRLFVREGSPYPTPAMLGLCDDLALTETSYFELGKTLHQVGIDLNFAPVADVSTNSLNPIVGVRSFSNDFVKTSRHLSRAVVGLQKAGVGACIKHFPGHGGVSEDSHHDLPKLLGSLSELEQTHIFPFIQAMQVNVESIMVGHIITPAIDTKLPASLSRDVITGYLKQRLGYKGIVATDALDMGALGGPKRIAHSALSSIIAGADLLCFSGLSDQSEFVSSSLQLINQAIASEQLDPNTISQNAARLRLWNSPKPHGSSAPKHLPTGRFAASLEVHGDVRLRSKNVHLIELSADPTIAAGYVAWGMRKALTNGGKTVKLESSDSVHKVTPDSQLVVAFRDAFRDRKILSTLEKINRENPETVFVDMGWPTSNFNPKNLIRTYGSSALASEAAATHLINSI